MFDEEIYIQCPECHKIYDLRYFLNILIMDECIFCFHNKIQSRL